MSKKTSHCDNAWNYSRLNKVKTENSTINNNERKKLFNNFNSCEKCRNNGFDEKLEELRGVQYLTY